MMLESPILSCDRDVHTVPMLGTASKGSDKMPPMMKCCLCDHEDNEFGRG